MKKSITIYKDFKEDKRLSMDIYANELIGGLKHLHHEVNVFTPKISPIAQLLPSNQNIRMRFARYLSYPSQIKPQTNNINHIIDHGYAHLMQTLPLNKTVVTVHDIIPLLTWKGLIPTLSSSHRPLLVEISLKYLQKARHLFTVSQNTKNDLIKHCNCHPDKITVAHNGLSHEFKLYPIHLKEKNRKKFAFPNNHKVILVSGNAKNKNINTSLKVICELRRTYKGNITLVRFGRPINDWAELVKKHNLDNITINLGELPQNQIVDLYNSVDCLLFPSLYEGFGWPPLEAMACGTPTVVSNAASLPEVVGSQGLMAQATDTETLTKLVLNILEEENFRAYMIDYGLSRAKKFTWSKHIDIVRSVYDRL